MAWPILQRRKKAAELSDEEIRLHLLGDAPRPTAAAAEQTPAVEGGAPRAPAFAHSPFTPTRPILTERGLMGRRRQLDRAIGAIQIERAHLTIFGERGNGKTSFSNVLAALAGEAGYGVVRHTCSTSPSFGELFGAVVAQIPARFLRPVMAEDEAHAFGRRQVWTVATAVKTLQEIRAGHVLIMIDEFDRLSDMDAKRDMTELLKTTSDLSVRVSFVLIGVGQSIGDLLALHPSLQRTLVAVPLGLLPDSEIAAIVERGCGDLRLSLDPAALEALLGLARGSPYFGQLLSLHASDAVVRRGASALAVEDVASAAALVREETQHSFEPVLGGMPRRDPRWPALVYAAAQAECDSFGWFTAAAAKASADRLGFDLPADLTFGLTVLASEDGGNILRLRQVPGHEEFAFAHVNLRNYVLLREGVGAKAAEKVMLPPAFSPVEEAGEEGGVGAAEDGVAAAGEGSLAAAGEAGGDAAAVPVEDAAAGVEGSAPEDGAVVEGGPAPAGDDAPDAVPGDALPGGAGEASVAAEGAAAGDAEQAKAGEDGGAAAESGGGGGDHPVSVS